MTDGLVVWLRAQLDTDEAEIAKHPDGEDAWVPDSLYATAEQNYPCDPYLGISKRRALADVDAKRRILDVYRADVIDVSKAGGPPEWLHGAVPVEAHTVLRLLALPYADRPGYRPEWAPDAG